ncbi:hypothetical protein [Streptomyces sp. NPDC008092]|uniref:hypothetical protein n=1 Tax=Streptomyces sp. NPDC008092 TaxID=3364808 RepID=UPI0036DFBDC6
MAAATIGCASYWARTEKMDWSGYGLWLVTALLCAVTALFRRLGTCAVVPRAETLVVPNPVGAQEAGYEAIRKVSVQLGGNLKILTVRDEWLFPAVAVLAGTAAGVIGLIGL